MGADRCAERLGRGPRISHDADPPRATAATRRSTRKYIQSVVRDRVLPARQNSATAVRSSENPKLAGRLEMSFTILGDPKIGGVVDDVKLGESTSIYDVEMLTCMGESLMAFSFDSPPEC